MYNSSLFLILNETINQKRSKSMYMRYHWLTDRVRKKKFDVYCLLGTFNIGDFRTKHYSAQHHKDMRLFILHQASRLFFLRGCVKIMKTQLYMRKYVQTCQRIMSATQIKKGLSHAYDVTIQNSITDVP